MGWFDRFFGKKQSSVGAATPEETPEPPPTPETWSARVAATRANPDFEWTWGNTLAHALVRDALEPLLPDMGGGDRPAHIKEVPDDEHIDLRGHFGGAPIRFSIWMSFGSFWGIELRVPMRMHGLVLERDHEKVPRHGDPHDPWEDDAPRRIFLAKGIFVEGDAREVEERLTLWSRIEERQRAELLSAIEALDARALMYVGDRVVLHPIPSLDELDDPAAYMRSCAELVVQMRDALAAALPVAPGAVGEPEATLAEVGVHPRTCGYCSSWYLVTHAQPRCPNCGAPPSTP